jgi:hypothetical protein
MILCVEFYNCWEKLHHGVDQKISKQNILDLPLT